MKNKSNIITDVLAMTLLSVIPFGWLSAASKGYRKLYSLELDATTRGCDLYGVDLLMFVASAIPTVIALAMMRREASQLIKVTSTVILLTLQIASQAILIILDAFGFGMYLQGVCEHLLDHVSLAT